ncbi:MAG: NAD(P)-dependent oxidoreductase [Saprospiraceae bacterium]|nr:NAD(P)-dependent oxidoreductase [Saprospiraceae bacterium]
MVRALVTDYVHPLLIDGLKERGYEVDYNTNVNMDTLPEVIHRYTLVVINSKIRMFKDIIDLAPMLKFICRLGSGLEIIDLEYAAKKNIQVINTPTGNNNAVAEHAMGMLLALANNLIRADREVRQFQWNREKNRGWELKGKTLGIIGFGHTGSQFAKKLSSWELNILSYDKYRSEYGPEWDFVDKVALEDILNKSDVISLHLPMTEETRNFVDWDFINRCKDKVIILNTSRGKVVKTLDLVEALEEGRVGGACLDVFENEKPHTYSHSETNTYTRLNSMENVVLSPHIAGWTFESLEKIAQVTLNKIDFAI